MADPRDCTKLTNKDSLLQRDKKGIFDAFSTLGNLEFLNEVGFGKVRNGLEVLGRVSDSVRSDKSVVPGREGDEVFNSTLGSIANVAIGSTEEGANVVLDAVGIGRNAIETVANFDAGTANRALGQAKQVFEQVKAGNFSLDDIPGAFQDLQNLEVLVRKIFTPTLIQDSLKNELNKALCQPSPFAIDLVAHAPRYKFMYVVDIKFTSAYSNWNSQLANGLAFITKSATRPQVDFEYDEVNMYNYWTQVIKRTRFNPMSMRFIDDSNRGHAMNFYAAYMRAISPITNKKFIDSAAPGAGASTHTAQGTYESDSMAFTNQLDDTVLFSTESETGLTLPSYSASVGALNKDANGIENKGLLASISLYHIGGYGKSVTAFHMFNPRITSLQPDELNMADNGDGSEFSFEFNYDSLFVDPNLSMVEFGIENMANKAGGNAGAVYPLNVTVPPDGSLDAGGRDRHL